MSGLPVTGVFDDATKAAMNKPRCGVPDQDEKLESTEQELNDTAESNSTTTHNHTDAAVNATDAANNTEPHVPKQRHLAALLRNRRKRDASEWTGHMAFSKSLLKWRLIGEGYSSQLSIDEQKYIFRLAFRMWSEVSPLQFVEDVHSPLEDIDIRLGFGTGQFCSFKIRDVAFLTSSAVLRHMFFKAKMCERPLTSSSNPLLPPAGRHLGCSQRFDGAGREFAHAWFLGDIHFDDDEHFTVPNTGSGISLLKVMREHTQNY